MERVIPYLYFNRVDPRQSSQSKQSFVGCLPLCTSRIDFVSNNKGLMITVTDWTTDRCPGRRRSLHLINIYGYTCHQICFNFNPNPNFIFDSTPNQNASSLLVTQAYMPIKASAALTRTLTATASSS